MIKTRLTVMMIFGVIILSSCGKDEENTSTLSLKTNTSETKSLQGIEKIEEAERYTLDYRKNLVNNVPVIEDVWEMQGFIFDESFLPTLVELSSTVSEAADTITIIALDIEDNSYRIEFTMTPYVSIEKLGDMKRWPTANEWTCLGITLAGSALSAGAGLYFTIVNFAAICAVEDEPKMVKVEGWYNMGKEFSFEEVVFEGTSCTHMDAKLQIYEKGEDPVFIAKGLIKGDYDNSVVFTEPFNTPLIEWDSIGNPGDLTTIPNQVLKLNELYGEDSPYILKSTRNALIGELIRLTKNE